MIVLDILLVDVGQLEIGVSQFGKRVINVFIVT
jgi:hypothetical protein